MSKIITISREFGSGGRELGRCLAKKLGYAYYDKEIVREIAAKTKLSEDYVNSIVEKRPFSMFPIHTGSSFQTMTNPIDDQNQLIFREQCNILKQMADQSDCVIVGRCADYILSEREPLRIFVYADMDYKIKRCLGNQSETETLNSKEVKKKILSLDRQRAQYYMFFSGQKWGEKEFYDLCINMTNIEMDAAVASIAALI
ncbi:MAG: cytidylate kinase-like family protein [Lachnospiraceae bacterium]|nr:cytidylate kinase-like family protein [Lachnospiraceae bacterium]